MRWVLRLAGFLVVLLVLAVAAVALIPGDRIATIATDRFEAATGREMRVAGDVRPSLWPVIGVATGPVEIDGPDGVPMLTARGISVGVDPFGLLSGDIRVRGVEIQSPDLILAVGADGRGNWEFDTGGGDAGGGLPAFTLDRLTLTDGRLRFIGEDGSATELSDLSLTAALPDANGPITARMEGRFDGIALQGDVTITQAASFLAGQRTPVSATLDTNGAKIVFDGHASTGAVLDGDLTADVTDPAAIPQLAGLPPGLGAERINVETGLAFSGGTLALAGLTARLDGNTITGAADITLADPRPRISADIALGDFDLASVDTPADEVDDADGWSTEPIDVSFLDLVDGDIRLSANSLALGTARLGATVLDTRLEDRRSVTAIERMSAYDGTVGGEVILNGRGGFSTRVDVAGSALAISRLLSELIGYDNLIAAGDLQLDVLGSGPHMDAVMNSLNGRGAFNVGAGELIGLDIVGMLRNLDPSLVGESRRTIFDEITVSFRVVDGVVIYDDLSILAPLFRASGTGRIGIGGQTLDMRLLPELLASEGGGLRVPLLVRGTWDAPRIGLDVENIVRGRIESEVERFIEREGAERLGITAEEGQSVEDAVRGRIEDEVRRGLGNLLGR